ncbi:uncharacterized protein TRIVIDRAFT_228685 [Trichoderma virens Gv29-8]|uniref:Uncharacterized protein n=1 Tax=Hypocrea virens (strain Gv29-8 / FGSC 10586) TaxID=413071 RepID=G9ND91_HYPVG|nr:uncharacterized protein TRIVIDRAFT_228685 [Trichoderma virens Gv29-8]EHK15659.1 hypothetical protein TRIVIDRAFT_228685 [Trichoderma virens Gv29-8]UKZ51602.1 hypothetical protein TrVGV298_005363 [Trichoderma virens]
MAISKRPNTNGRKRIRSEDEEDELAWSVRQTRTRTSAMPGLENWEAFAMRQLAERDPEVICAMLDATRAEIRQRCNKIKFLEAKIEHVKKTEEEKRCKLDDEIGALRNEMHNLLLEKTEDFGTTKTSDDTIKSMWWKLSYKIKNIVSNYFTEWPQGETIAINDIEDDQHEQITPADHIADPHNLPSPQYLQMISKMKSALDLDLEKEGVLSNRVNLEKLIERTVVHFGNLVADKKTHEFEEEMRKIFSDAWKIHTATITSKAIFIMQWSKDDGSNDDCPYNPETMEFFDGDVTTSASARTIQVVESPILWKIGNGDGENFDSYMILCKHCVFLGENKDEPSTCTLDESSSS